VRIDKYTGENMGVFNADGSVDLYYDNAPLNSPPPPQALT
jgi:hypothetical protein